MNNNKTASELLCEDFWINNKIWFNHNVRILPKKSKISPKIIISGTDEKTIGCKRGNLEEPVHPYKLRKYKN